VLDYSQRGTLDLRRALVLEVRSKRAMAVPKTFAELDCEGVARKKVAAYSRILELADPPGAAQAISGTREWTRAGECAGVRAVLP
jgi:hypothetical protein